MPGFNERYGPWAVIAGATEGTGAEFSRQIAAQGINCILVARREAPLTALAQELRVSSGVDCAAVSLDLGAPDAMVKLLAAIGDRKIGLLVYNVGSDSNGRRFLDQEIEAWLDLTRRNDEMMMRCCHHFGRAMKARGRGGLLLANSGAAYGGGDHMAVYTASKAFELCLGESLWAELSPQGVDVLNLMIGTTDTPTLRALLAAKGQPLPPNLAAADAVARVGLAKLSRGPTYDWGEEEGGIAPEDCPSAKRRARIIAIGAYTKQIFGDD